MSADPAPLELLNEVKASHRLAILRAKRKRIDDPALTTTRESIYRSVGRDKILTLKHRLLCRTSFKAFVRAMWPVIEPGIPLIWNWHIDVICEVLEAITRGDPGFRRVLINVPPGHMKSRLVAVLWPAWNWLENPGRRSLFVTYHQRLSNRDSSDCRTLLRSKEYQELVPRCYGDNWDQPWTIAKGEDLKESYATSLRGFRLATSITGLGTGFRGDDVVVDDPLNVNEFPTAESLDKVNSWFDKRMSTRFNDQNRGNFLIIMQRLHDNDLAGYVLAQDEAQKKNKDWIPFRHICLRSEYDPDRPNEFDRRKTRGELLFPARFSKAVIERAKIVLGAQYSAQHDQDPVSQAGGIFPMHKLCFWIPPGLKTPPAPHKEKAPNGDLVMCRQAVIPSGFHAQIQSWDLAFKDEKTSDFVSGGLWAAKNARCYLIDESYGHMSFSESLNAIRIMSENYPGATAKYIEDAANGPAVMNVLENELFGITPVGLGGKSKIARAHACEPLVSAGNVWLPHPALYPWVHQLLAELRAFPKSKHDDRVDMLTQALAKLALSGMSLLQAMTKTTTGA